MFSITRPRKALLLSGALALLLSGCAGGKYQDAPVGVGRGPNDLKQTPCSCMTLENLGAPANFKSTATS